MYSVDIGLDEKNLNHTIQTESEHLTSFEELEELETNVYATKIYETNALVLGNEKRPRVEIEGKL